MKELDPRIKGSVFMLPDKDTGSMPNSAREAEKSLDTPTVMRDKQGRVVWKLPGNTLEQNEQLGISDVQALFLEKFPEFNELFPRREDGKIAEEKKAEAKQFIVGLGSHKKLRGIVGSSPTNNKFVPYFDGSLHTMLRKTFADWGSS